MGKASAGSTKVNMAEAAKLKDEQGRPLTWDYMKSRKRRPIRTIIIPLDDEMAAEWQDADGRLNLAKMRLELGIENDEIKKVVVEEMAEQQARIDDLRQGMEGSVATFRIQGLGRKKYEELGNDPQFTPSSAQIELNKKRNPGTTLPWNVDTYPPVLIQRCMVMPEMSLTEVKEMWSSDDWTQAELLQILNACIEVNEQVRNIDWGKG